MKLSPRSLVLGILLSSAPVAILDCTPQQSKDAHEFVDTALDIVQLACLMNGLGGFITDAEAAAKVCKVAPKLVPVVSDLIGVRDAARKSGVVWKGSGVASSDAGVGASEAGAAR